MKIEDLIGCIERSMERMEVHTPSQDYYRRHGDSSTETITFVDANRLITELQKLGQPDENDSFEEEPVSFIEMVSHGKSIGATHLLVCSDGNGTDPSATYVMPGEDVDFKVDQCLGGCGSVETVPL